MPTTAMASSLDTAYLLKLGNVIGTAAIEESSSIATDSNYKWISKVFDHFGMGEALVVVR